MLVDKEMNVVKMNIEGGTKSGPFVTDREVENRY